MSSASTTSLRVAVVLGDPRDLALRDRDVIVSQDLLLEELVGAGRAQIDVEDVHPRVRILLPEVGRLLERGQAADPRAVAEMILIARSCALDEDRALDRSPVGWPEDLALRGTVGRRQSLHHHVGDDVRISAEPEVVDAAGVVGVPAGGHDDGARLERHAPPLHAEVDRLVLADLHALGALGEPAGGVVDRVLHREGHLVGEVDGLRLAHAEVEGIGPLRRAHGDAGVAGRAAVVHVARHRGSP